MGPEALGRLLPLVLGCLAVLYWARRASKARPRPRRLAGLGVACGLVLIPLMCVVTFARGPEGRAVFVGVGITAVLAGFVAVAFAWSARTARKQDRGSVGASGPAAVVLGILSVCFGLATAAFPFVVNPMDSSGATAWVYKVEPPGFELTLPSDRWRKYDRPGDIAMFSCRTPQMVLGVKEVRPALAAADFEKAVDDLKRLAARNPVTVIEERRGPNANGLDHWRFLAEEKTPNGRVLVGMSATWWDKSHAVILLFEGQHQMASEAAQDQEAEAFRASARTTLSSVK